MGATEPVLLGVIKNMSTMRRMLDMFVYDDAFLVAKGSTSGAALRGVGAWAAAETSEQRRLRQAASAGRQELLDRDAANRLVPYDRIVFADLTRHLVGSRLVLNYLDGATDRFEWKRTYNDHAVVSEVLRRALGSKLRLG